MHIQPLLFFLSRLAEANPGDGPSRGSSWLPQRFVTAFVLIFFCSLASARDTIRGSSSASPSGAAGTPTAGSQTATAATAATAQAAQAAVTARRAQDSFIKTATAFQALQSTQAAARAAALATPNPAGVIDGLGVGGLNPVGGTAPSGSSALQIIELSGGTKNQLALGSSGSVTLPSGTPGSDQITVTGAGSVNSAGGTVTASAGSVTTSTGGILAAMNGGTVSLTAGSGTLTATTATMLTSTLAGTVTLPAGGGTVALAANQAMPIQAGSTISFTGSGAGTVTIAGTGTVALSGAGTLALASASPAHPGGTITTSSGTTSFTNGGSVSSLAAGSQINIVGSGTINLTGTTDGSTAATLPLILSSATGFTTTGTELTTQSYSFPTNVKNPGGAYNWSGVSGLSQSTGDGLSTVTVTVTVTQNSQEALLYWSSFNVGKKTLLDFDQSAGGSNVSTWVAINQIVNDPSLAPSQILGRIQAPGQVYVINQNGIIFGGSSQVNTHNLTASSLPINTNLITPEVLLGGASTEDQFLFSQLEIDSQAGTVNALPTFNPPAAPAAGDGDVKVEAGAQLSSPTTPEHVGGRIALIGPVVDNEGTISTPDGQTILAAGLQVGFDAHAQTDPTLRGLDTYVGQVVDPTTNLNMDAHETLFGTVTNGGLIDSPRADITLTGMNVNQNGEIASLTSVSLNGRIDLLADYGAAANIITQNGVNMGTFTPTQTGNVTLGPDSLTEILPDTTGDTIVGTTLALNSLVNVAGLNIHMASGAQLLAPGALATSPSSTSVGSVDLVGAGLTSGINLNAGTLSNGGAVDPAGGSINLDDGATIDASGSQDVAASVTENIVTAQLRGSELADFPLQQNGALRGQTVNVDIGQSGVYNGTAWIGSPVGDLSGYAGLVQHTVNELTVNGGTVGIQAGGSVAIASGATINVSGGSINYQGANVQTTKVVTADGRVLDISQATPDLVYQGIYTGFTQASAKWGISQSYSNYSATTYEAGYIQGGNGGALTISTPSLALQGGLYGNTVAGPKQVNPASLPQFANANFSGSNFLPILVPIQAVPSSSTLILNFLTSSSTPAVLPPDIVFQPSQGPKVANPFAGSGNPELDLSSDLVGRDGFSKLIIDGNSPITSNYNATAPGIAISTQGNFFVPEGVTLVTQPGGAITLFGVNVDIEGSVYAPGGSLSFTAQNIDNTIGNSLTPPPPAAGRGNFTLGANASLSAAGLLVNNEAANTAANTEPNIVQGGTITIKSLNADLESGSFIDASGGAVVNAKGNVSYGAGGKIDIEAGQDPYTDILQNHAILGGTLNLGSELSAFSGSTGGSLSILAPSIQIGGSSLQNSDTSGNPAQESNFVWGNGTTLWLNKTGAGDFFSQGGFSNFTMTGLGLAPIVYASGDTPGSVNPYASTPGIVVASGTTLYPLVESYHFTTDGNGSDLAPITYPLASQRAPVNLTFTASGVSAGALGLFSAVVRGDLVMDSGTRIETDPLGSVTLNGQSVAVLGTIYAPGGRIKVSGASDSYNLFTFDAGQPVLAADIVATVDLGPQSVLSTAGTTETTFNSFGYNTGTVLNGGSISISGNIVAETGSLLDVSGTSAILDVSPGAANTILNGITGQRMVSKEEASNGGTITFAGGEELFLDSTLVGAAGSADAQGGTLSISNGSSKYSANPAVLTASQTPLDATLFVTSTGPTRDSSLTGQAVIGQEVVPSNPAVDIDGNAILGYFAANSNLFISTNPDAASTNNNGISGGFGSLILNGTVQFSGPVSISTSTRLLVGTGPETANSTIITGGVIYADSPVTLSSAYVSLGLPFLGPNNTVLPSQPTSGVGMLTVNASQLIDIGDLSLGNIDQLNVFCAGDVRGDGTLNVTGNISITAAQIYPTTDTTFNIAAFNPANGASTVTFATTGNTLPPLPLSAGGTLNVYADTVLQEGVLRAPMGTINLGSLTPPSGSNLPITTLVTLSAGSVTSVSAVDPNTNTGITIPYGQIDGSGNWIDPAGNTITAASAPTLPAKIINISATNVNDISGSTIDIRGGGELVAAQFVSGTGGTNDILGSTTSFAIIPSIDQASFAPFDTDSGYATTGYTNLQIGDQIYLAASNGLAAGFYTLLPARYALLPDAFLITPKSGTPSGTAVTQTDGSVLVSGYRASSLNSKPEQPLTSLYEVASQAVISSRADYLTFSANSYFPQNAIGLSVSPPRLPVDAGQVQLNTTMSLNLPNTPGTLLAQAGTGGLGSIVDITRPTSINIYNSNDPSTFVAGDLNLDAASLNSFGADSLLIGGFRTVTPEGTVVTVSTEDLTVNNAGMPLIGPDIILVSNGTLTVAPNASIESEPTSTFEAPVLQLSGNGVALRTSSDSSAQIIRTGVSANAVGPNLAIGQGAFIGSTTGSGSVILDSSSAASLDPLAVLSAKSVALDAGQISLVLSDLNSPITTPLQGLVLSSTALSDLQSTAQNFSLLSYTSLDIWGSGDIGQSADSSGNYQVQNLVLHSAEIRGFDNGGNTLNINAQNVNLDNSPNGTGLGPVAGAGSTATLAINSETITLGINALSIDQYAQVTLSASKGIVLSNGTGSLATAGDIVLFTPLLTSAPLVPLTPLEELRGDATPVATTQTISAGGNLSITNPGETLSTQAEGLGADLTLTGASVTANSNIQLPSGSLTIVAASGNLSVGGNLDVSGTENPIYSLTEYTSGGQISLSSYAGNVSLDSGSTVNVSAQPGGGNAGNVAINAPKGTFAFAGSTILGQGGAGGQGGTFFLDAGNLTSSNLSPLEQALNPVVTGAIAGDTYLGGFTNSQTIRLRNQAITVDGLTAAQTFNLSSDAGSITVGTAGGGGLIAANSGQTDANGVSTATIDVTIGLNTFVLTNPGVTGGSISLEAGGSVTLVSGSLLSVAGQTVNDAGKGGSVTLEAGDEINGVEASTSQSRDGTTMRFSGSPVVDIQTGSVIDLSVAAKSKMFDGSEINGTTGVLHLRAPQTLSNADVQIDPINGLIINPSNVVVEGYQVFNATDGSIDNQEAAVMTNGTTFVGNSPAILTALISGTGVNSALQGLTTVEPGAEIINMSGDLTLASNWDLSTYRFGSNNNVAGDLTLRTSGNLVFDFGASLSDGFTTNPTLPNLGLWAAVLLPTGSQSWSYRLVSGADFSGASYNDLLPPSQTNSLVASDPGALAANSGFLEVGLNTPPFPKNGTLSSQTIINNDNFYQTIRTGTGDIDINAGRDVQLLNNIATIYTAGTQSGTINGFDVPILTNPNIAGNSKYDFPSISPESAIAQYSQGGGNLSITAQGNISHYTAWTSASGSPVTAYDINGNPLMDDSSKELPTTWLYRRGFDNGGVFATNADGQVASTTWWVDFSNFFEGVGALGGGNVTLNAGGSINNVDAAVPTNARMPGTDTSGNLIAPSAANLIETGGGDLVIKAGGNINGGVDYVERGDATLNAAGQVLTNATRTVVLVAGSSAPNPDTFLPTTFFLGKGNISLSAGGNVLLGSVVNPFLLPQGINNTVNDKSYFSTYAPTDSVNVSSLTGTVTIDDSAPTGKSNSLLSRFYSDLVSSGAPRNNFSFFAPWLGLVETSASSFDAQVRLMPPTLNVTAFSGDIDLSGNITLSPSPSGTLNLVAAGSLNAFQPVSVASTGTASWASSQIDLSDAAPNNIPGIATPLSYFADPTQQITLAKTNASLFTTFSSLFNVSGSTTGLYSELTTQEALHASLPIDPSNPNSAQGPLHADDSTPVHLYAATGNIDGLNLFSGKFADVVAGTDITNVALYVQNVNSTDITLVEAGRDIIPYDKNSSLRELVHSTGGIYFGEDDDASDPSSYLPNGNGVGAPNAGDIQIGGPGTLEVLAGRNLNLGNGPSDGDGTGLGIVTIGNTVDPSLTTYSGFGGANVIAAAGLGGSSQINSNKGTSGFGLDGSNNSTLNLYGTADKPGFVDLFLNPTSGGSEATRYLPDLGSLLGVTNVTDDQVWNIFSGKQDTSLTASEQAIQAKLTPESRDALAMTIFYDVLRDAGRDHNNPSSPNVGTYAAAYTALGALFPTTDAYQGDITLTSREIKTTNGGDISLLAPGGGINVGLNNSGTQAIDQGILTVDGGNISIFTNNDVSVGTSRIFTLHGGDEIIWSTTGNIAAGASSKTVQSAPPTRVLIDTQSGNVETDLAGLATGGGIGVLQTIVGAAPGNVDLIAPSGIVDAGDAGIRASGNINIAASQVLNAGNIQSGGSSSGVPTTSVPNIGATVAAAGAAGSSQSAANAAAKQQQPNQSQQEDVPSIISVQVIGYGGGDDSASTSPSSGDKTGSALAQNNAR